MLRCFGASVPPQRPRGSRAGSETVSAMLAARGMDGVAAGRAAMGLLAEPLPVRSP